MTRASPFFVSSVTSSRRLSATSDTLTEKTQHVNDGGTRKHKVTEGFIVFLFQLKFLILLKKANKHLGFNLKFEKTHYFNYV